MPVTKIIAADLFCGAGGTSTGLIHAAARLNIDVDLLAVNHWKVAVTTHQINHPHVRHLVTGLEDITPENVVPGKRLDLLWASPSCTHHSIARAGKPRSDQLRAQPSMILDWLDQLFVRRLIIENVPEFQNWGPLGANHKPLPSKKGVLFADFIRSLEAREYQCEWKTLCCADYGDATSRERFFLQAVRKGTGAKICWPRPTHCRNPGGLFRADDMRKWRTAREIINWQTPTAPIFQRKKPLAKKTLNRIDSGIRQFWGLKTGTFLRRLHGIGPASSNCGRQDSDTACTPFLVSFYGQGRAYSIDQPIRTITTKDRYGLVEQRGDDVCFRMLQPLEYAAAHSFPADYQFSGTRVDIVKQIGNSVPTRTSEAICLAALADPSTVPVS